MGRLVIQLLTVLTTGLAAGAMMLIGVSWVPVWQGLEASAFLALFAVAAPLIGGTMLPIGSTAVLMSVVGALVSWRHGGAERVLFGLAAALMLITAAIYPLYYTEANTAFGNGSIALTEVGAELLRWESWHWVRTTCTTFAFVLSALGLSRRDT